LNGRKEISRKNAKRPIDREMKCSDWHLAGNFSAEKCLDRLYPGVTMEEATRGLTNESELKAEPPGIIAL
jgi:hypothetical protein